MQITTWKKEASMAKHAFSILLLGTVLSGCMTQPLNTQVKDSPRVTVYESTHRFAMTKTFNSDLKSYLEKHLYYLHEGVKANVHVKTKTRFNDIQNILLQYGFVEKNIHYKKQVGKSAFIDFTTYKVKNYRCPHYQINQKVPPGCFVAQNRWQSFDAPQNALGI